METFLNIAPQIQDNKKSVGCAIFLAMCCKVSNPIPLLGHPAKPLLRLDRCLVKGVAQRSTQTRPQAEALEDDVSFSSADC
jgi:hypothetical protein